MNGQNFIKDYNQIVNQVDAFNKSISKAPFEIDEESITKQENSNQSGKNYFEVFVHRDNSFLQINGFTKPTSKEYDSVGIRVAKIVGDDFELVYPSTNMKTGGAEGTEKNLKEALLIADKL